MGSWQCPLTFIDPLTVGSKNLRFFNFIGWCGILIKENKDKHATEVKRLVDDKGNFLHELHITRKNVKTSGHLNACQSQDNNGTKSS